LHEILPESFPGRSPYLLPGGGVLSRPRLNRIRNPGKKEEARKNL
jgi:hypothetical protein